MSALRLLALSYLASASVFLVTAGLMAYPDWPGQVTGRIEAAIAAMAPRPAPEPVVRLTLAPPPNEPAPPPHPREVEADNRLSDPQASAVRPILPDLSPEAAPVPPEPRAVKPVEPLLPDFDIAVSPRGNFASPSEARLAQASWRLKQKLSPEMLRHFDLFLYVSKAKNGPLAQRMLVFEKDRDGGLTPSHDWAASTGREQDEISPRGRSSFTATPKGFYELDPARMYRRYHSFNWDRDMPDAMFFNWERQGVETGLAIHAATNEDIAKLGHPASAGCVHLAPENAAMLYDLIRTRYRGAVPRFAYNPATQTMSNRGEFMRDRRGRLAMMDGYRVLVVIDDYGGDDRIAALDEGLD